MKSLKARFKRRLIAKIANSVAKRGHWSRKLANLSLRIHRAYENFDNYDFASNGESLVLRRLADHFKVGTVFDVGANQGEWALTASAIFPEAYIHAFEIVPETYRNLVANCGENKNIIFHDYGLSDNVGKTNVFFSGEKSRVATCIPQFSERFHGYMPNVVEANVSSGDLVCEANGISTIDLLKIDVEGYEHKVLMGFERMLKKSAIKVIQFEYGYVNIDSHFLLKDFYGFLEQFNMRVGKIYPNYVDLRDYRYSDENFFGPNYLAVHASCGDLANVLMRR